MLADVVSRDAVVAEARSWTGVRWVHQGRSRTGIDCIGLVVVVRRGLGIGDYDIPGYPRVPDGSFLSHFFTAGGVRVEILKAQPADLLLFKESKSPCHVGIITQRNGDLLHIEHAHASRHKVVEEPVIGELRQNWVCAIRMPGVD